MKLCKLQESICEKWLGSPSKLTPQHIICRRPLEHICPDSDSYEDEDKKKIIRCGQRFVCGVCKKSFSQGGSCARHYEVHLGNTTCQICKAVLASTEMLRNHMVKHAGSIRCEKCNSTFAEHRQLQKHKLMSSCLKAKRNRLK
jgi:transposase-like protein